MVVLLHQEVEEVHQPQEEVVVVGVVHQPLEAAAAAAARSFPGLEGEVEVAWEVRNLLVVEAVVVVVRLQLVSGALVVEVVVEHLQ